MTTPRQRTIMGVISVIGYGAFAAIKVYTFGWNDTTAYWVVAGAVGVAALLAWLWLDQRRVHRQVRGRIERSASIIQRTNRSGK